MQPRVERGDSTQPSAHAYPHDLTDAVYRRCADALVGTGIHLTLPDPAQLDAVLSVCYQASLLREEGRTVAFRVAWAGADMFPRAAGPPAGLHRLVFSEPRPFDQQELRRLAPAAMFSRTLIGASSDRDEPRIWGIIHSGAHWLQSLRGGRETQQAIPPIMIVAVSGPGRMLVSAGGITIAELTHGTLIGRGMDVFQAAWLEDVFAAIGGIELPRLTDGHAATLPAAVDPKFGAVLACHVLRRVLAIVRGAEHGGMLVIVPESDANEFLTNGRHIRLKYPFVSEEPRRRLRTLTTTIINELATAYADISKTNAVGWRQYEMSDVTRVIDGDAALFEAAHLVADLTHVDGAVVLTSGLDLVGFGGEIAGDLPDVPRVMRARDLAGEDREWVRTDRVGTRHRAAYRLCHTLRAAVAIVVSQDGGLRFVRWHNDAVTYWEQVATAPWEV